MKIVMIDCLDMDNRLKTLLGRFVKETSQTIVVEVDGVYEIIFKQTIIRMEYSNVDKR